MKHECRTLLSRRTKSQDEEEELSELEEEESSPDSSNSAFSEASPDFVTARSTGYALP